MLLGGRKEYPVTDLIFWDVDVTKLDADNSSHFIIEKVLLNGKRDDVRSVLRYYGDEKIIATPKAIGYLDDRTMCYWSNYYDIPLTEMRCYTKRQSSQGQWNF